MKVKVKKLKLFVKCTSYSGKPYKVLYYTAKRYEDGKLTAFNMMSTKRGK